MLDRYRVDVLDGDLNINDNCDYWQLTTDFTGAEPPVNRSNGDFDAPAKLLVEVDDQYTRWVKETIKKTYFTLKMKIKHRIIFQ